jgi:hypothetical protein
MVGHNPCSLNPQPNTSINNMVVQVSILVNLNIIHKVSYKYSVLNMAFENHKNSSLITITKLAEASHYHANKDYKYHM